VEKERGKEMGGTRKGKEGVPVFFIVQFNRCTHPITAYRLSVINHRIMTAIEIVYSP